MSEKPTSVYERLLSHYESGEVPWDDPLPPPEVRAFVAENQPGRALDLGCGYGRASIYLAQRGWEVDAVDFVRLAISVAADRAAEMGLENVRWHINSVTDLDYLAGPYDFILDVGCAHSLPEAELRRYHGQVSRLLADGGTFLLFARLRMGDDQDAAVGQAIGVEEDLLREIFAEAFILEWVQHGETEMSTEDTWPSGWFRFERPKRR
jgi:cyclopropane fatty-acyl-phospholipid synthase-like methyltransferase